MEIRYEDDKDEGEWFLYTGSGGRDLSGNKRVNKVQSFDQTFDKMNKALLISCQKGLPVRVVRSHKVILLTYAPVKSSCRLHFLLLKKNLLHCPYGWQCSTNTGGLISYKKENSHM